MIKQAIKPLKQRTGSIKQTQKGLSFNGLTDYLQLPSMTMDSIEIECFIDSNQPNTDQLLFDGRTGKSQFLMGKTGNAGTDVLGLTVDNVNKPSKLWTDIPKGQRTKIKAIATSAFTDDVTIFTRYQGDTNYRLKGIIYKVTCYLGSTVVAQYDFENPKNIIGNTVLQNANNLIPDFENSRWQKHANTTAKGKNVLLLNATSSGQRSNIVDIPVTPLKTYKYIMNGTGRMRIARNDNDSHLANSWDTPNGTVTIPSDCSAIRIGLDNNTTIGTFDFVKPQLYELDGKQATITGAPIQLNKSSKEILYVK